MIFGLISKALKAEFTIDAEIGRILNKLASLFTGRVSWPIDGLLESGFKILASLIVQPARPKIPFVFKR